jgi:hypothetical protein
VPDTVIVFSIAGPVEVVFGVKAERQSLESIAQPLTAQEADTRRGGPAPATT